MNESFVKKSTKSEKNKKSKEQIKKTSLQKEQERLELVTELSRELPSLIVLGFS